MSPKEAVAEANAVFKAAPVSASLSVYLRKCIKLCIAYTHTHIHYTHTHTFIQTHTHTHTHTHAHTYIHSSHFMYIHRDCGRA